MRKMMVFETACVLLAVGVGYVHAHCQIPCGIYDDETRVKALKEHVVTIEKSMKSIEELGQKTPVNYNQIVRWVTNKDDHAQQLMDVVTAYFMCQRIKIPADDDAAAKEKYQKELALLHGMLVSAMKCKQTTDLAHVAKLNELIHEFEHLYFGDHEHHSH